jgi:hypothetical protein
MDFFIIVFYLLIIFFTLFYFFKTFLNSYLNVSEKSKKTKKTNSFNKLIDLIYKDFDNSPYYDKIRAFDLSVIYNFENGYRLIYTLDYLTVFNRKGDDIIFFKPSKKQGKEIINLLQELAFVAKKRPNPRSYYSQTNNAKEDNSQTNNIAEDDYSPKYYKILEKIKLREDHLKNLDSNSSEYESLKNELSNYKIALEKIKNKNG